MKIMSAAKMVADSTQSDLASEAPARSRRRKNTEKKNRKTRRSGKKVSQFFVLVCP